MSAQKSVGLKISEGLIILCGMVLFGFSGVANAMDIIPTPKEIEKTDLKFPLVKDGQIEALIVVGENCNQKSIMGSEYIIEECEKLTGRNVDLKVVKDNELSKDDLEKKNLILIGSPWENKYTREYMKKYEKLFSGKYSVTKDSPGEQGYIIRFFENETKKVVVVLAGSDPQGTLYAACSFLSLIHSEGKDIFIWGLHIRDWPDFKERFTGSVERPGSGDELELGKRQIDFLVKHKITGLYAGTTYKSSLATHAIPSDQLKTIPIELEEGAERHRELNRYAKARGLKIMYALKFPLGQQKGTYKECQYYKEKDVAFDNYCLGDESLMKRREEAIKRFVRDYEPGVLYIHGIDRAGGVHGCIETLWQRRCEECKEKWPSDEMISLKGSAGATINYINRVYDAVRSESTGKDVRLWFVIPPYPTFADEKEITVSEVCQYFNLITKYVPEDIAICAREINADYTKKLVNSMAKGQPLFIYLSSFLDADWRVFCPYSHVAKTFYQPGVILWFLCHSDELRTSTLVMAEYAWNCNQPGGVRYETFEEFSKWIRTRDTNREPYRYVYETMLPKICRYLYGSAGDEMTEFFQTNPKLYKKQFPMRILRKESKPSFGEMLDDSSLNKFVFKDLADDYQQQNSITTKLYPYLKNAWEKVKNDRLVSEIDKDAVEYWVTSDGLVKHASEILMHQSLCKYYSLDGDSIRAKEELRLAEEAYEKLKKYEEQVSIPKGDLFVKEIGKSMDKIRIEVEYLLDARENILEAEENIIRNDYQKAQEFLKKAREALAKKHDFRKEEEQKQTTAIIEKMNKKLDEMEKRLKWRKATFNDSRVLTEKSLKLGIYNADMNQGKSYGETGIYNGYKGLPGLSTKYIIDLSEKTLSLYNVLIFPSMLDMGKIERDWRERLRHYVNEGGGAIFCHNSCGGRKPETVYAFGQSVFPEIMETVTGRSEITEITILNQHPVTKGLPVYSTFKHSYYDHLKLKPGRKGKVLGGDPDPVMIEAIGEEAAGEQKGDPVIVVGEYGKGRVVFLGNSPGFGNGKQNTEIEPRYGEYQILLNAIKWAGGEGR